MYANNRTRRKWNQLLLLLVSCHFVKYSISSPIFSSQFSQFQSARNLRNLPCVVRKSGLKGVCMFAIDCIKTNGTHLGTCIDKFYFGSCCQVKDMDSLYNIDLDDNRIDSSFPSPSQQTSSSSSQQQENSNKNSASEKPLIRPVSATSLSPPSSTSTFLTSNYKTSSKPAINYNNKTFELLTTSTTASSSSLSKRPITTRKASSTSTTEKYSVNVGGFSTTLGNIVYRNASSTIKLKDEPTLVSTTESIKLTTFQSIQDSIKNDTKATTQRVTSKPKPTKPNNGTKKPVPPRPSVSISETTGASSKPTRRPIASPKPSKNATVIKTTTRKPVMAASTSTIAVNRRTTLSSRRNVTATRKPVITTNAGTIASTINDEIQLTTLSFVQSTKAPRPRPKPTNQISKVEATTVPEEDVFTTTYSVVSNDDDKKTVTTEKQAIDSSSTISKTPIITKRPVTRPPTTTSVEHSSSISTESNRKPITESFTSSSSIINSSSTGYTTTTTSTKSPSSSSHSHAATALPSTMIKVEVTQKPLNWTTQKIVEEIHQTTQSSTVMQHQQASTNAGLITWTLGNEVTDNATKDDAWILLTSVTPDDVKTPSIIDTLIENHVTESTQAHKPQLTTTTTTTENITQLPITSTTDESELVKVDETTLEESSVEGSSESSLSSGEQEPEEEEEDDDDEEGVEVEESTIETKPVEITVVEIKDNSTQTQSESLTTSTTRTISTQPSSSSSTQLSPNETVPVSIPDDTTVNPDMSSLVDETTLLSIDEDEEKTHANETTTSTPSSTTESLEGVDYKHICGRRMFPEARIVGGSKASFGRWPWQISLRQWRTSTYLHKCGSALLNENWAISAGHCVDNVPPSDLLLRMGEYDLSLEEEPYGYQERRVQIVASHPQFDPRTFEYDLALLRFYEPVVFQPNIIPICVPEGDEDFVGRTAVTTGWGRLYEDGPLPSVLQEVSVPVIRNDICEAMYRSAGYIEHIPHIFICAGWQKGGRDSCEGDSGGPMVIQRQDKRWQLAGIISWGIGCAEPNQPGVYTRISEFRDWINQILMF